MPTCGTNAGYRHHTRGRQEVCEPCALARSQYNAELNLNRKRERIELAKYFEYAKTNQRSRVLQAMGVLTSGDKITA